MVKFTHLFAVSVLVIWLVASGCVENNSDVEEAGVVPGISEMGGGEGTPDTELTETDIQEFEENITHLEGLLENSTEEIIVDEI